MGGVAGALDQAFPSRRLGRLAGGTAGLPCLGRVQSVGHIPGLELQGDRGELGGDCFEGVAGDDLTGDDPNVSGVVAGAVEALLAHFLTATAVAEARRL